MAGAALSVTAAADAPVDGKKSRSAIFLAFLKIGLCGFGGVATWARLILVEERAWLSEQDYAELLGVASILPGANTLNIAVLLGDRYRGFSGSLSALAGLLLMPLVIVFGLTVLYERFSIIADVNNAVGGAAAATAGLVIGTALRMMDNLKPDLIALLSGGAIFVAVGLLRVPLVVGLVVAIAVTLVVRVLVERPR
jgi:chromate transporter